MCQRRTWIYFVEYLVLCKEKKGHIKRNSRSASKSIRCSVRFLHQNSTLWQKLRGPKARKILLCKTKGPSKRQHHSSSLSCRTPLLIVDSKSYWFSQPNGYGTVHRSDFIVPIKRISTASPSQINITYSWNLLVSCCFTTCTKAYIRALYKSSSGLLSK